VGEILDGAFASIRRNPKATLGLSAVLMTLSGILSTAASLLAFSRLNGVTVSSTTQTLTSAQVKHLLATFAATVGITLTLTFIFDAVLTGMLTVVIGRSVLGHPVTAGEAWRIARPRLGALIGATLLTFLAVFGGWMVVAAATLALAVAGAGPAAVAVGVLGGFIAVSLSAWFTGMLRVSAPAVVLERQGPAQALARSWRLVSGSFWRVFGISLLAELIVLTVAGVLQIPFSVVGAIAGGGSGGLLALSSTHSVMGTIITGVGGIIAGAVARPLIAGVTVLLYVDLRMRKEGLDLALQTAARDDRTAGDEFASVWRPPSGDYTAAPGAPPW